MPLMKQYIFIVGFCLVFGLDASAVSNSDDLVGLNKTVFLSWLSLNQDWTQRTELESGPNDHGLKNLFFLIRDQTLISFNQLETISGFKFFLSDKKFSYGNEERQKKFVKYNPRLIAWLEINAIPNFSGYRAVYQPIFQSLYNRYMRHHARTFWIAYRILQPRLNKISNQYAGWCRKGNYRLQQTLVATSSGGKQYEPEAWLFKSGYYLESSYRGNYVNDAVSWWTRRNINGSLYAFKSILVKMLMLFDADWWDRDLSYLPQNVYIKPYWKN